MLRSLRSRMILASSLLWTAGLLMLMHMLSMMFLHIFSSSMQFHREAIVTGVSLMIAGVIALRRGLTPFRRLRERLTAIRMGEDRRVSGTYPREVRH